MFWLIVLYLLSVASLLFSGYLISRLLEKIFHTPFR